MQRSGVLPLWLQEAEHLPVQLTRVVLVNTMRALGEGDAILRATHCESTDTKDEVPVA